MARFGIEGIRYFSNARAAGVSTAGDLTYTFNRCNGLDDELRAAGHTRSFYWANTDCWETDIRDTDSGEAATTCTGSTTSTCSGLKPTATTRPTARRACSTTQLATSGARSPERGSSARTGTPSG